MLDQLPQDSLEALHASCERVDLKRRQVLCESRVSVAHVYFLESAAASLHLRICERGTLETSFLGCMDFVGWPVALGSTSSPFRCIVHVPGSALRIDADRLVKLIDLYPALRHVLLRYAHAQIVELSTIAACNGTHSLGRRLARHLLNVRERMKQDKLPLTHLEISRALGVRRAGVTKAVGALEEMGLLRRGRRRIEVTDPDGLTNEACNCIRLIRAQYQPS